MRFFFQAQAVITLVLQTASTLENSNGEHQALRKFSASRNLSFVKRKRFVPSNLADTSKTGQLVHLLFNQSQQLTANDALFGAKLRHIASQESVSFRGWMLKEI